MTYAIAIVNKNLVNRTVSFENELVPLNGRIKPTPGNSGLSTCLLSFVYNVVHQRSNSLRKSLRSVF